MFNCDCLIHPFQNDPGTSQADRIMQELLGPEAKIDGRTLADLLDFFVQLSRHINYFDAQMNVSDWQPFFRNSIPFRLANFTRLPLETMESNFAVYNQLFEKRPSSAGIQLKATFIYYHFVDQINSLSLILKDSKLPLETELELLIKDRLQQPVKTFIAYANAAVAAYGIKRINFLPLYDNKIWNIDLPDLYATDTSYLDGTTSKYERIVALSEKLNTLLPIFAMLMKTLQVSSAENVQISLVNIAGPTHKMQPPHLGLLFSFLKIFAALQDDLNQFSRKHLDFFYKQVLGFTAKPAVPDRAFVLFEIQKQLKKYMLQKGLLLKGGKDNNKQEILFSLDDEIVVNRTEIISQRTLFLNNQSVYSHTYLEGLYMAIDATKANGLDKDFQGDIKNYPTLGAKYSKYSDPESREVSKYPDVQIGFILASPVLFLQGGTREVQITLACQLDNSVCVTSNLNTKEQKVEYPDFIKATELFNTVKLNINKSYVYLDTTVFKLAIKKGFKDDFIEKIKTAFLLISNEVESCYYKMNRYISEKCVEWSAWDTFLNIWISDPVQRAILDEIFRPEKILKVLFSGSKGWVSSGNMHLSISNLNADNTFLIHMNTVIGPELPEITFFDKSVLMEDYNTTDPVAKISLNNKIKLEHVIFRMPSENRSCCEQNDACCLLKEEKEAPREFSYYHFFRNVSLIKKIGLNANDPSDETRINVAVCGLRKMIVQNDEGMQDVKAPIYPFGVRPHTEANFFIGSEEIFSKAWTNIFVNLSWKDIPAVGFEKYYVAYQTRLLGNPPQNVVTENKFKVQISLLQDGSWMPWKYGVSCDNLAAKKYNLFQMYNPAGHPTCNDNPNFTHEYSISHKDDFLSLSYPTEKTSLFGMTRLNPETRNGFLKVSLKCQDFQHEIYAFILARQMTAFAKLPKETVDGAVYYDPVSPNPVVFSSDDIKDDLAAANPIALRVKNEIDDPGGDGIVQNAHLAGDITGSDADRIRTILYPNSLPFPGGLNLALESAALQALVKKVNDAIANISKYAAIIPNEPWTPIINAIALDYKASATVSQITLIHLHPFPGTYKHEEIDLKPSLFPRYCDEGSLFLGLDQLQPGNNLNLLFQLAEATADSEGQEEEVMWHYLDSNGWKPLRKGFEVLDDGTENLTTSGILKFALPENMSKDNTVMPKDLHWIRGSVAKNSKSVSETTGIHPQAIEVIFDLKSENDQSRLAIPLPAGSIAKLNDADASVKSVQQPYESFGGQVSEASQMFYVRVSESLRHKGRAVQAWDYERLTLEAFPQIFKAKCLNHSVGLDAHEYTNDFPYAPGYVVLAVIPDLNKLKPGDNFEPRVPMSILEKIQRYIAARTSPFVRFRPMNPRYEKLSICISVGLLPGMDQGFYREKLRQDIKEFLAPWAVGQYSKLTFGQCVYRSDLTRFVETRHYVDYISDLRMSKHSDIPDAMVAFICPDTARSILVAGIVEVSIVAKECEHWGEFRGCGPELISRCDNPAEKIIDYCKSEHRN